MDECRKYQDKYHFGMQISAIYKVNNGLLEGNYDKFRSAHRKQGKTKNIKRLFHGTARATARVIVADGFKLPEHPGMFGKGVYFAGCPLKSLQYSGRSGTLLLCEAELGLTKVQYSAHNDLQPQRDFKRGWFAKVIGCEDFDSIEAPAGFFGSVRVPEYVIYKPEQAVPRYLLVAKATPKFQGGSSGTGARSASRV